MPIRTCLATHICCSHRKNSYPGCPSTLPYCFTLRGVLHSGHTLMQVFQALSTSPNRPDMGCSWSLTPQIQYLPHDLQYSLMAYMDGSIKIRTCRFIFKVLTPLFNSTVLEDLQLLMLDLGMNFCPNINFLLAKSMNMISQKIRTVLHL